MLSRDDDETSSSISDQLSIDPKICPFAFKLTDLQGQIHRFSSPSSLEELRATVSHRLNGRVHSALQQLAVRAAAGPRLVVGRMARTRRTVRRVGQGARAAPQRRGQHEEQRVCAHRPAVVH